jgi:hypothetical protein
VLLPQDAGMGAAAAGHALAALTAQGIGYVVLGEVTLGPEHFDSTIEVASDGTWTHPTIQRETA